MKSTRSILLLSMVFCATVYASAQESTEIQGFYQTYRNFSLRNGTGLENYDISDQHLNGGGFTMVRNMAPWFAMWTQLFFSGTVKGPLTSLKVINNLEGVRYQTKQHGPFRFYVKGGIGFSRISVDIPNVGSTGETKFSAAYGGGVQIWFGDHFGIDLGVSQVVMKLPNLFNGSRRDNWDSGITYTPALAIRF